MVHLFSKQAYTAIRSWDYDGWVNRVEKQNGYTKMQGGFKVVPCLLGGLVREGRRGKKKQTKKLAQRQ